MKSRVKCYHTIGVDFNSGAVLQQQSHNFHAARLSAVVQGCVTFDTLSIHVCLQCEQEFGNFQVTFVADDHETRVTVSVGDFNV
jgi:hypothetical protein